MPVDGIVIGSGGVSSISLHRDYERNIGNSRMQRAL